MNITTFNLKVYNKKIKFKVLGDRLKRHLNSTNSMCSNASAMLDKVNISGQKAQLKMKLQVKLKKFFGASKAIDFRWIFLAGKKSSILKSRL